MTFRSNATGSTALYMLSKAPHQTANGDEALCQRATRIMDGDADGGCRQPAERESLKQRKRGGLKQRRLGEISSDRTPRQFPSQKQSDCYDDSRSLRTLSAAMSSLRATNRE